jgi:RHS repeat-associated protein
VNTSNAITNSYEFDPFGNAVSVTETVVQPMRFAGREFDAETGLYYMRARYYEPQLGRFISEDPLGLAGGINSFVYANNDPVNRIDPDGTCELWATVIYENTAHGTVIDKILRYYWAEADGSECDPNGGGGDGAGPGDPGQSTSGQRQRQPLVCPAYLQNATLARLANQLYEESRSLFGLRKSEQQGWFLPTAGGGAVLERRPGGAAASANPYPVPVGNMGYIHVHPNYGGIWIQAPSPNDIAFSNTNHVTIFVVSKDSIFSHAPNGPVRGCAR